MFELFTDAARQAVTEAQAEAKSLHHNWLGTEHLLLGLFHDVDGVPAHVLTRHGVDFEAARAEVEEIIGERHAGHAEHPSFTARAKTVLQIAQREARDLGQAHIGSGHLLLALIREGQGVAPQVLARLGADLDDAKHEVVQSLAGARETPSE